MSWCWLPEQFSYLTFHRGTTLLSLNIVFLNARDWWKTPDFCQNLPDQGFYKVWALLLRSKFDSCKRIWDWVLRRNFQHNMSCYWLPEQVSGLTFLRAPVQFPLIWYFWILGIDGKPLTFMKMSLTKTPPRSGPCSFGASSIPANVYGIDFWKELSNTTRTSIGHQSNFLPWPFTRAPYHFPFIWYFITQVLIENPWLSSKFAVQGFSKVWALLLWSNFHSWKCFFD